MEKVNQTTNLKNIKEGHVYCVTSDLFNAVRIGVCTYNLTNLRYQCNELYGVNVDLFYVRSNNPYKLKKKFKNFFREYNEYDSFFKKDLLDNYKLFLQNNNNDE